jgi:hypothetical protein
VTDECRGNASASSLRYFARSVLCRHTRERGYPVRRGPSLPSRTPRNTGSPSEPVIGLASGETRWRGRQHTRCEPAFPRHAAPEFCQLIRPENEGRRRSSREGAGKTGCALHPRSRVQKAKRTRTRAYRFSGSSPAFPAQWFYGLFRALPGDRLSCHRRPREISHELDASIGASGPHDFAVHISAVRQ